MGGNKKMYSEMVYMYRQLWWVQQRHDPAEGSHWSTLATYRSLLRARFRDNRWPTLLWKYDVVMTSRIA